MGDKKKCSDRSIEIKLLDLLGNCDRKNYQATDELTGRVIGKFHFQNVYFDR